MWSSARPGVATTMSAPRLSARICASIGAPPYTRDDREPEPPRVLVDGLGDLHRQLARRHQHQPARAAAAFRVLVDPLQHRQRERRRLAGARRRLPEHVAAREQQRDRLALDRRRLLVAEGGRGGDQRLRQPERGEVRCRLVGFEGGHGVMVARLVAQGGNRSGCQLIPAPSRGQNSGSSPATDRRDPITLYFLSKGCRLLGNRNHLKYRR